MRRRRPAPSTRSCRAGRSERQETTGNEPTLWLVALAHHLRRTPLPTPRCMLGIARYARPRLVPQDKACIDQDNIQQSLACLPVFLAGCQTLLVVAGATYCSRLWCVMELFTFARSERLPSEPCSTGSTYAPSNRSLTVVVRVCVLRHSGRRPRACRDPSHRPPGR